MGIQEAVQTVIGRSSSIWGSKRASNSDIILFGERSPSGYCVFLNMQVRDITELHCDKTTSYRFLCNDCNGVISKYATIPINATQTSGSALCNEWYDSSLASIHSDRDQKEVQTVMNIAGAHLIWSARSMWIGLEYDSTIYRYMWTDDTEYDYGSEYIQKVNGVYECTALYTTLSVDGGWLGTSCDFSIYPVCSVPSELSLELSNWISTVTQSEVPDSFDFVQDPAGTLSVMITDKQWFNGDGPLLIDYTLSIDFYAEDPVASSLRLYNGVDGAWCSFYTISVLSHYISLTRSMDDAHYNLKSAALPIIWNDDSFYLLSIAVTNGTHFSIKLNDQLVLEYDDGDHAANVRVDGYSGYIGLFSDVGIQTTAKSLYVSGTPMNTKMLTITTQCQPSLSEGNVPTSPPSSFPTESLSNLPGNEDDEKSDSLALVVICFSLVVCMLLVLVLYLLRRNQGEKKNVNMVHIRMSRDICSDREEVNCMNTGIGLDNVITITGDDGDDSADSRDGIALQTGDAVQIEGDIHDRDLNVQRVDPALDRVISSTSPPREYVNTEGFIH